MSISFSLPLNPAIEPLMWIPSGSTRRVQLWVPTCPAQALTVQISHDWLRRWFKKIYYSMYILCIYIYGCGSKCKVWIKPRSHKRSRPLIQTPDPDLSKGVDPDLWSRPLEWYFLWASWCLQLFTLPSSQATNCFKATLPSCQASKLHFLQSHAAKLSSCQAAKLHVLLSHAFKLSNCNCSQATKLSSYQADIVARPGCQAAKVSTCCLHLVVLFLSPCIQAATYTNGSSHFGSSHFGLRNGTRRPHHLRGLGRGEHWRGQGLLDHL